MSISTVSIQAGDGLHHGQQQSQKMAQPASGSSAQGTPFSTPAAGVAVGAKDGTAPKLSREQTQQSLQEINKVLASLSISVQFQIDPDYKDVIVKVVDQQNDKVILQIPSVEVVRVAKAMDSLKGLLFSQAV